VKVSASQTLRAPIVLLEGAVGGVTLPGHGGVENEALLLAGGKGYIVTHVPPGLNVPYRTVVKGEKEEYYIRVGSNFFPAPHAVLAGLFGRAPHSTLEIKFGYAALERASAIVEGYRLSLRVALRNKGRGLARGIYLCIDTDAPDDCNFRRTIDDDRWQKWASKTGRGERLTAVARPDFPAIPPGSETDVLVLVLEMPKAISRDITIDITCGTETGPGSSFAATLQKEKLNRALEVTRLDYTSEANWIEIRELAQLLIEACLSGQRE
jgi:hypothetical protein